MSQKKSNILAIGIMFFLFAMISFVTGLQNPMGLIVKAQFGASNAMSQLGNLANFIAYAFLGLPAGFILKKYGYKVTSLAAVAVGFIGVGISYLSGVLESFPVYLTGAFVSGFSMCMLNTAVNPMLNTLGGGGNKGNQLIQLGGSCNSLAATIVPVFVGYLIGDASKAKIADANPALFIAMGIFALAFIIIAFSAIPEPELEAAKANRNAEKGDGVGASIKGALLHRNLVFGIIAIFLYVGIEVGVPNIANLYMTTPTTEQANTTVTTYEEQQAPEYAETLAALKAEDEKNKDNDKYTKKVVTEDEYNKALEIKNGEIKPGLGMAAAVAGTIVGIYWLLMLCGRLLGGAIGAKVSSKTMMTVVSSLAIVFILLGIFLPETLVKFPTITSELSFGLELVPLGVVFFVLCGLCTSVMWGAIFNLAVEGLGKYTSIASGLFMVMVCGGGILPFIQGAVADATGFINSYWVLVAALAYILWFALVGSKVVKK